MLKRSFLVLIFVLILSSTWVAQAGVDPSLMGWWEFDEGSGIAVNDSSGNDHHGTIQGTPQWGEGPEGFGTAVDFSGTTGAYCDVFDPTDGTGTFTMSLWCLWDGTQSIQHFMTKSNGWGAATAMFQIEVKGGASHGAAQQDRLHLAYSGQPQAVLSLVPHNEWTHLALVFDGTHATGYRNGIDDMGPQPTGIGPNVDAPVIIGASHAAEGRTFQGLLDDVRLYSRPLSEAEVQQLMLAVPPGMASEPSPANQAIDVPRDVSLGWTAGEFAAAHDVYLGTAFDDVNAADRANTMDVLLSEGQSGNGYDAGRREFGQIYYWRVDEVNAAPDNTIYKGEVWSFTTELLAYPIENIVTTTNGNSDSGAGPENTVNGSGLNAADEHSVSVTGMWLATPGADPLWIQFDFGQACKLHEMLVWNYNAEFELILGFGLKDVTIEYSENGTDWITLGDEVFAQAPAQSGYVANTTVAFGGIAARFVRLTVNSGYGMLGQFGLSEVRFLAIPVQARQPEPAAGVTEVEVTTALNWYAGRAAATHDVYLGTDPDALPLVDSVSAPVYVPGDLDLGQMYYWKINEVNEADEISVWEGTVWSFTTQEFALIDGMESYDNEDNRIYDTWLDGWVNETGSTVGYLEEPFAERTTVNTDRQAMPLLYDNSAAPFYSAAERDLGGMDLDTRGADTLRLFVYASAAEPFYVALEDTAGSVAVVVHPDPAALATGSWQQWQIPYSDFAGVDLNSVGTISVGVGDRNNPTAGGAGTVFIDDIGFGNPAVE
jgi:Concanavalin A-like lectin/glucanases superfamily/F5/8 type C domain